MRNPSGPQTLTSKVRVSWKRTKHRVRASKVSFSAFTGTAESVMHTFTFSCFWSHDDRCSFRRQHSLPTHPASHAREACVTNSDVTHTGNELQPLFKCPALSSSPLEAKRFPSPVDIETKALFPLFDRNDGKRMIILLTDSLLRLLAHEPLEHCLLLQSSPSSKWMREDIAQFASNGVSNTKKRVQMMLVLFGADSRGKW